MLIHSLRGLDVNITFTSLESHPFYFYTIAPHAYLGQRWLTPGKSGTEAWGSI